MLWWFSEPQGRPTHLPECEKARVEQPPEVRWREERGDEGTRQLRPGSRARMEEATEGRGSMLPTLRTGGSAACSAAVGGSWPCGLTFCWAAGGAGVAQS